MARFDAMLLVGAGIYCSPRLMATTSAYRPCLVGLAGKAKGPRKDNIDSVQRLQCHAAGTWWCLGLPASSLACLPPLE